MRWIWIDRFTEFHSGKFARAVKNLTLAEEHFADHFPDYPIMPAALMLEGLAQTGGILAGEAREYQEKVVLAKITGARFHREVFAGESLTYETDLVLIREEGAAVKGRILIDGTLVGEADIQFAHLDQGRARTIFGDFNFVFSGELKYLLGLAKVASAKPEPGIP